ncbi:hypothetical protein FOVG_19735 [Fusarium oxysporum f. sp. pisi HDV247]|uniref:Uncharacterized protein n=1 Tax=Fusarium oxysporum f. sp. pisi HDV247 TaxID=1080344 RepID=W9ND73_FUSOX|nr:hypothetical protein FOVG_19735 [Fusarium oxysporum f. sp. pisi HDV247]
MQNWTNFILIGSIHHSHYFIRHLTSYGLDLPASQLSRHAYSVSCGSSPSCYLHSFVS